MSQELLDRHLIGAEGGVTGWGYGTNFTIDMASDTVAIELGRIVHPGTGERNP